MVRTSQCSKVNGYQDRHQPTSSQPSGESAKMRRLKNEIKDAFLNIVPCNILPALIRSNPELLTSEDVAQVQDVTARRGDRAGAADLLERLSRHPEWIPCFTRALQDPTVNSETKQISVGNKIDELTCNLQKQKEGHSASVHKLQTEIDENRQMTLKLMADVGGFQEDQKSQDARLGQQCNIQNLLREVVRQAQPTCPTYNEEIQKSIRYTFECLVNPDTVIGVFHKYNEDVLVQQDIERVRAISTNYGKTRGASELLDILPRYKDWFDCLVKVLEDPVVQQGHVAKMMKQQLVRKRPVSGKHPSDNRGPRPRLDKTRPDKPRLDKTRLDQKTQESEVLKRHYVYVNQEVDGSTSDVQGFTTPEKRPRSLHRGRQSDRSPAPSSTRRDNAIFESSPRPTLKTRLDVLLVGKTGNGKSSTGNTIIGHNTFLPLSSDHSDTSNLEHAWVEIAEYRMKVVDGLRAGDTRLDNTAAKARARNDIMGLMKQYPEGFHALLLVLKFGEVYTQEEQEAVRMLKCIFQEDVLEDNCIIVFTHGERFDMEHDRYGTFKEWLSQQTGPLKSLISECRGRCVLFRNATDDDLIQRNQVKELLQMIGKLTYRRVGYFLKPGSPRRSNPEQALDLLLTWKAGVGT